MRSPELGEKLAGSEKLGFALEVLQHLGVLQNFLRQVFYYVNPSAEPSCKTPKATQNSGEGERRGEPRPVL